MSKSKFQMILCMGPGNLSVRRLVCLNEHFSVHEIYSAFNLPAPQFRARYGFEKPAKVDKVYTHCKMGKRATDAADKLVLIGYENVAVYR